MTQPQRMPRTSKTETEVAVLQVEVAHLREDVADLKSSIKRLHTLLDESSQNTVKLLKEMREVAASAHNDLNKKIGALEKWRYMMMGAGIVIGYFGFEMIAKLLQAH